MIRTFIAIDVPDSVKLELEKLTEELKRTGAKATWVKPGRMHLTIKFLGDVSSEKIDEIKQVLQATAEPFAPLRLQPVGCGAFPSLKQMRVVWVGLRGDDEQLRELHKSIEAALSPLGFPAEDRPFRAHLTLGRIKDRRHLSSLQEALLARQKFQAGVFDVDGLTLYKSDLRPTGPIYTPLFRASFAARDNSSD